MVDPYARRQLPISSAALYETDNFTTMLIRETSLFHPLLLDFSQRGVTALKSAMRSESAGLANPTMQTGSKLPGYTTGITNPVQGSNILDGLHSTIDQ
jgi:hypothetical protein